MGELAPIDEPTARQMELDVCPNCGQWQHPLGRDLGRDCMNECRDRGLASPRMQFNQRKEHLRRSMTYSDLAGIVARVWDILDQTEENPDALEEIRGALEVNGLGCFDEDPSP